MTNHKHKQDSNHYQGCLLGGAVGDALGWPVEFYSIQKINSIYGKRGITDLKVNRNGVAEITDDTQMTLFTAEGLLRALTRFYHKGICNIPSVVHNAYLRWLYTQGEVLSKDGGLVISGELIKHKELYNRRAPGNSCLSALKSIRVGSIKQPVNNSKGCGGVMRVAPVGLMKSITNPFRIACECAALTHGHPSGYLAAGTFALIIHNIINDFSIVDSVYFALDELRKHEGHEECSKALHFSIELANNSIPAIKAINHLGEGWVAEEALAISVFCALRFQDNFERAVCAAVNHDGDSDSTGAITGNIIGAYLGIKEIPNKWVETLELNNVISKIADDIVISFEDTEGWWERYPGY